jgi:hypothetical protein
LFKRGASSRVPAYRREGVGRRVKSTLRAGTVDCNDDRLKGLNPHSSGAGVRTGTKACATRWRDAYVPVYVQAKAEYGKLQE